MNLTSGTLVSIGAVIEIQGGIAFPAEFLILNGADIGGITRIAADADTLTIAGSVTLTGAPSDQFVVQGAGNITVAGSIGGTSGVTCSSNGAGIRTVSDGNTFTGKTRINGGTLAGIWRIVRW